jgi:hypothetical protein
LFVSRLFMARQMTMGVSGRPAAWDLLYTGFQIQRMVQGRYEVLRSPHKPCL